MTQTLRSQILESISNQLEDLALDEQLASYNEPLGNIIQFVKSRWGISSNLYYSENLTPEDLFEANRLHLREVQEGAQSAKSKRLKGNVNLIITKDSGSLVEYQVGGVRVVARERVRVTVSVRVGVRVRLGVRGKGRVRV